MDTRPVDGVITYDEGVFVGHRAYDRDGVEPHRPFGFGLGYTDWEIGGAELSAASLDTATLVGGLAPAPVAVTATLTNTGARPGHHVVQVYVEPPAPAPAGQGPDRPLRSLAAFASVHAAPGEESTVRLDLPPRSLAVWDPATHSWRTPKGTYHLSVGSSSRAIAHRLPFYVR
jgi:beta-glucosidase